MRVHAVGDGLNAVSVLRKLCACDFAVLLCDGVDPEGNKFSIEAHG